MPAAIDLSFPHFWQAVALITRPLILPPRHFVYPRDGDEVERGALEVLVRPEAGVTSDPKRSLEPQSLSGTEQSKGTLPFLATCALGFRDPAVPTGVWSTPNPKEICAVSGGYAYLIDTTAPEHFTMIPYRPVLTVCPLPAQGLLLFVGHHNIFAWGAEGEAWQTEKLSDEGVTITSVEYGVLRGLGWELITDREIQFAVDLRTGLRSTGN